MMTIQEPARPQESAQEIASLAERMGYMQALRAIFAIVVVVSTVVAPDFVGASVADIATISGAYVVLSVFVEAARRKVGRRAIAVVEGMLLVDAVYLALIAYATGGIQSPLRFLVYVHIIAVTLLTSYRTGIKIATWHALLFFVTFYAQSSELLPALQPDSSDATTRAPPFSHIVP